MQEVAMGRGLRLAAFVSALALVSSPARADKVALTGGVVDLVVMSNEVGGLVNVQGDRGFTFVGSMFGSLEAPAGNPLPPGTTVTLVGGAIGSDLRGTATFDGVTYPDVGGFDSTVGGSLQFTTTVMLPAVLNAPATVTGPFAMELRLFGLDESGGPITFSGTGTARTSLGEDLGFGMRPDGWLVTDIQANLSSPAPVPEPATALLLGGGLAGVTLTRLRRRRP
jgi:PEP-CTERM motif